MLKEYLNPDLSVVNLVTIAVTFSICKCLFGVTDGTSQEAFPEIQKKKKEKSVNTLFLEYFVTLFNLFYQKS